MQLVIAEKPSVARDIARVLGVRGGGRSALASSHRVITWCIGHLVELEEPAAYDPAWKSWRLDALPMIPAAFKLRPVEGTRGQFEEVGKLLRDRRFVEVVNACDAGREGELIFRYVYELAGGGLPIRRLWISSMTDEAIRRGFESLRADSAYADLAAAARCRSEADWLVGMNATRAVTLTRRETDGAKARDSRGQVGGDSRSGAPVFSIGRVQTPTLAIVVRREKAIRSFLPQDYWEVRGTFAPDEEPSSTTFAGLWGVAEKGGAAKGWASRLANAGLAETIVSRAGASAGRSSGGSAAGGPERGDFGARASPAASGAVVESVREKKSREPPPPLFDLTSLQRTANRRHGYSATRTLEVAQALYERHKLLTYPRTDSRHLTPDLVDELPRLFRAAAELPDYATFAEALLAAPPTRSKRVFDETKVHDHHAIIPTGKRVDAGALSVDEARIFDLVMRRFLGVFFPDAEFALTDVVVRVGDVAGGIPAGGTTGATKRPAAERDLPAALSQVEGLVQGLPPPPDRFFARGRVRLAAGWQAVAQFGGDAPANRSLGREGMGLGATGVPPSGEREGDPETGTATLPPLREGQRLSGRFESVAKQTKPPPRYTEASLLGAMESAGREIEDESLRVAMRDTGLGTPATRAATIETLVKRSFITRQGKQIVATEVGIALIETLPVPNLASPELTGAWEARLARIARGQDRRTAFMADIGRYVREMVDAIRRASGRKVPAPPPSMPPPPPPAPSRAQAPAVTRALLSKPARARPARGDASWAREAGGSAGALICPSCQRGALVAGKRGWGCARWRAGCPFVVWFETAGRRLTEAQLRDLVQKGKTRKGRWRPEGGAEEIPGRLVLDAGASTASGGGRFQPA